MKLKLKLLGAISVLLLVATAFLDPGILLQFKNGVTYLGNARNSVTFICSTGMTCTKSGQNFTMTAAGGAGNVTSGTLTANTVPKASGAAAIANSLLTDDATTLTYGGTGGISATGVTTTGTATQDRFTEMAAPATPNAGFGYAWYDATNHRFNDCNSSATCGTTVVAITAPANQFFNSLTAAGGVLGSSVVSVVNKMSVTAPTTSSTLAVLDGKTFTVNNTLTLAGTDGITVTFPTTSATMARTDASQSFTGLQTMNAGVNSTKYGTNSNCSSSAGTCVAASSGSVSIAAAATTVTVTTTQMTTNSAVLITEDSSLGTKLSVTCNTTTGRTYSVTARTNATSFVITASAAPTTNPACLSFLIIN